MNITLTEKIRPLKNQQGEKTAAFLIKCALCAVISFLFSQLKFPENFSPFCTAFAGALPFDYLFAAFTGGAIGYFVSQSWKEALFYLLSLAVCCACRLVITKKFPGADKSVGRGAAVFFALFCCDILRLSLSQFSFIGILTGVCEAAVGVMSTIVFNHAMNIPVFSVGLNKLSVKDSLCLIYGVCSFIMCACALTVGNISPVRILTGVAIIFIAQYKNTFAPAAGICAGAALCITQEYRFLFVPYALGGFASSLASPLGGNMCALAFLLSAGAGTLLTGTDGFHFYPLAEAAIAAAAYAVIPARLTGALNEKFEENGLEKNSEVERQVSRNLKDAAQKVFEVSDIVARVSERLDKVINPEINKVFAKMQQSLCFGCEKKTLCWNQLFSETAADIMVIAGIYEGNALKTNLERRCVKPNALKKEVGRHYGEFVSGIAAKMKIGEMRGIVSDQFSAIAQFLEEVAANSAMLRTNDEAKAHTLLTALHDAGIDADNLYRYTSPSGRVSVEMLLYEQTDETLLQKITAVLEKNTGKRFERPQISVSSSGTHLCVGEKPCFGVLFGQAQIPLSQGTVCGDCVGRAYDPNGVQFAVLSDGMGTGSRAAIDATMTATLMEKLLSCGFSFESAVKTVNSALIIKSTDESLSTVDTVGVNVYTADAVFYKAGAAASFIRSAQNVRIIEQPSMPLGIIRSIVPAVRRERLSPGDIVLLVSDGVTAGDCGWISDELLAWSTNSMDDLAKHIASLAKLRSDANTADDITVIALKICENR